MGHLEEAKSFFERALAIKKDFLPAVHNLENLASVLVERWHFRMLNDAVRNETYREAIFKKIRQGFNTVLDIGTGTSLLSLYAVQGGAKKVFACECSTAMVKIAQDVIRDNNAEDKIELIPKMSTELKIPTDLPSRMSLVVTETLDAGVFGEQVLQSLSDAWDRLLLPPSRNLTTPKAASRNAIVIPFGATVFVAGVQCPAIARSSILEPEVWDALGLGFKGTRLAAAQYEEYNSENLEYLPGGYKFVTSPQAVLSVNFNDPEDLKKHLAGKQNKKVEILCCEAGRLDAFVTWFVLQVDEDLTLSSEPGKGSCWEQAVFALNTPLELQTGQTINIDVTSSKGILNILFDSPQIEPDQLINSATIELLNDRSWSEAMQNIANSLSGVSGLKVLDLSPFPYLGLLMLNMGMCNSLTCLARNPELVKKVAGVDTNLVLIDNLSRLDKQAMFDKIIVFPCTTEGELDQEAILSISDLRKHLLSDGEILPRKITLTGQIWDSKWLESVSKLQTDDHVGGFKISVHVNKYKLKRHLDLCMESVPHSALSGPQHIYKVDFSQQSMDGNNTTEVFVTCAGNVSAVAYWFEFDYGPSAKFETNRIDSHLHQAAVLLDENVEVCEGQTLKLMTNLQSGVFNISFVK